MGYWEDLYKHTTQSAETTKRKLKEEADRIRKARLAFLGSHGTLYGGGAEKQMTAIDTALLESLGGVESQLGLETAKIQAGKEQEKKSRLGNLLKTIGSVAGGLLSIPITGGLSAPALMAGLGLGSAAGGLTGGLTGLSGAEQVPSDIMGALEVLSSQELDKLYKRLLESLIPGGNQPSKTAELNIPKERYPTIW